MQVLTVKTGDRSQATDEYRSLCGCHVRIRLVKGQAFPECPICNRTALWGSAEPATAAKVKPGRVK